MTDVSIQVATATGRIGDWMQTVSGRTFYPLDPRPEDIDPGDIAHALSMICRFGGHTSSFYSVAEHCVLMSSVVRPEHALWALLHDGAEAYIGDMVRPLKYALPPDYRAAEARIVAAICSRFGLQPVCPREIKDADLRMLRSERDALMPAPALPWVSIERVEPLGVTIQCWPPDIAKMRFQHRLDELLSVTTTEGRRCDHCGDFIDPIDWCPGCIKAGDACNDPHRHARKRADARYCDAECAREARKPY